MPPKHTKRHFTATEIIRRLPLHRQLDESQTKLVELNPTWQTWATSNLSAVFDLQNPAAYLSAWQNGKLTISCKDASCASLIKHQQQSLLEFFQQQGRNEVHQIVVKIQQVTSQQPSSALDPQLHSVKRPAASPGSVKAIEACKKMVSNEQLANSLGRLAETMKKN